MINFVNLFFDVIIVVALCTSIFYCLRLSRQFRQMQADRKAFESLIQNLNLASARAEAAIHVLKESALDGSETLQEKIGRGRALSDELEIMIQAGDSLANRLESLAEKSHKLSKKNREGQLNEEEEISNKDEPRTKAEKALMKALKSKKH